MNFLKSFLSVTLLKMPLSEIYNPPNNLESIFVISIYQQAQRGQSTYSESQSGEETGFGPKPEFLSCMLQNGVGQAKMNKPVVPVSTMQISGDGA